LLAIDHVNKHYGTTQVLHDVNLHIAQGENQTQKVPHMPSYDINTARTAFPAVENILYLDSAHQTPLARPIKDELDRFYDTALQLAGPKHLWLDRVEEVRAQLAGLIGARPEEVAFTKNTSEGLNICANGVRWEPGDNVLLLESEHPNNAYAWLAKQAHGLEVRRVPSDKKWADAGTFAPYLDARSRAIGISHVMFHNGQRNDVAAISQLAATHEVPLIVDSMQSIGVMPLDVHALGVSALASGSHKGLLTPQGLGFLWTAEPVSTLPPTYVANAGINNARADLVATTDPIELRPNAHRFEIGNFNLAAIHALGAALSLIESVSIDAIENHTQALGDQLIAGLDNLGVELAGPRERQHRAPHIYVLALTNPELPVYFADHGVRLAPVRDGLRVSLGMYSNSDDIDRFLTLLAKAPQTVSTSEVA
jgi:cysteine desulfurase / selenocysteine lyase